MVRFGPDSDPWHESGPVKLVRNNGKATYTETSNKINPHNTWRAYGLSCG